MDEIKCKKFICFSLYGVKPKYSIGMIENCKLRNQIYPEFDFLIYYDSTVPQAIINILKEFPHVHLIKKPCLSANIYSATKMMWRFEEFFSTEPKILLSRDADSLINVKERAAVEEWLLNPTYNNKHAHIMRDHRHHTSLIMGGMWGIKITNDWNISFIKSLYERTMIQLNTVWGFDQKFLNMHIYPHIVNTSIKHCSHNRFEPDCLDFPKTSYNNFVGNYFM